MTDAVLTLPNALRSELKDPLGEIHTDVDDLLAAATLDSGGTLVAVGDVVTSHLLEAGHVPSVALVDERTERSAVDDDVAAVLDDARETVFDQVVEVDNPAATLTDDLLRELAAAVERAPETTLLAVDGEEDLAALPAVLALGEGDGVVYGQPGEGMVLVAIDGETRERARSLLERMDGDYEAALGFFQG